MIPPLLHYVWVGGPMPAEYQRYVDTWQRTNGHFTLRLWNEANIDMSHPLIRRAYAARRWATVADIARLQAVWQEGGIYLDTDIEMLRSLDSLRRHQCFYAFQEKEPSTDWVGNSAFGATPHHWFIRQALDGLYAMKPNRLLPERPTTFGPKHITRLLCAAGLNAYSPDGTMVKDVFVAPVETFFPFSYNGSYSPSCITERTLGVHYWAKSWEHTVPRPIRMVKRLRDQLRTRWENAARY